MKCRLTLLLCLGTLGFASCATVPSTNTSLRSELSRFDAQESQTRKRRTQHARVEIFRQDIELDDIEFDPDDAPSTDLLGTDRERTGVRATFGGRTVGGFVQLFVEEWDLAPTVPGFDFDLIGVGGGVAGTPTLHEFNENARLTLPFRAGVNLAVGDNGLRGANDTTLGYLEFEGEIAIGADLYGAQPSVGIYVTSLSGIVSPEVGADADVTGTNGGAFAQILYKHPDFPVFGSIRALGGDVEGGLLSFGVAF